YLQPILDLYWTLTNTKFSGNSRIRVSTTENGYSTSIVALTVFCIESLINNLKYFSGSNQTNTLRFFSDEFPAEVDLIEKLNELFTVRNVIAHNHIWRIRYRVNNPYIETDITKELLDGYGNANFRNIVDFNNNVTRRLRIRIIPTRIGENDAKKELIVLNDFSNFLDRQGKPLISNWHFRFPKKLMTLKQIVRLIER
ncbi:MAG: hypothetical protein ACFFG0_24525, partial [Candidatus Thorarchaeota archaeon]